MKDLRDLHVDISKVVDRCHDFGCSSVYFADPGYGALFCDRVTNWFMALLQVWMENLGSDCFSCKITAVDRVILAT